MALDPKPGLVVRYDFLWRHEKAAGQDHGSKDRPCAIILASAEREDGAREVLLCAITHTPPEAGESAVKIPADVARQLRLDDAQSWIKTSEVNLLTWEKGRIPVGIVPARKDAWAFGILPWPLGRQAFEQVREKALAKSLHNIRRDEPQEGVRRRTIKDKPPEAKPQRGKPPRGSRER